MRIKQAKDIIKYEVTTTGVVTDKAMRLYVEHRISKNTFDDIVRDCKEKYKSKNQTT